MQRTGTTSVGKFFQDFGLKWVGWQADVKNGWTDSWQEGDHESIFASRDFRKANAFEDSPWWLPDFYKVLFSRFPKSKFILLTRNPDDWFRSMINHSNGNAIYKSNIHCKIYRRELEYFNLLDRGEIDEEIENQRHSEKKIRITADHAEHYKEIYRLHNLEAQNFFQKNAPDSLHVGALEDPDKWQKMGRFLSVEVPVDYDSHENTSIKSNKISDDKKY